MAVVLHKGFCVKCRKKVDMHDPVVKHNKRRVKMLQAVCRECKSRVNTFLRNEQGKKEGEEAKNEEKK